MAEYWDIYDENRRKTNKLFNRGTPRLTLFYHLVAQVWVKTSDNLVLITRRHPDKSFGGCWECSGGSAISGEETLECAVRELFEEVGISAEKDELTLIASERYKQIMNNGEQSGTFIDTYLLKRDVDINHLKLQTEEVTYAKLINREEYLRMCENGEIVGVCVGLVKELFGE